MHQEPILSSATNLYSLKQEHTDTFQHSLIKEVQHAQPTAQETIIKVEYGHTYSTPIFSSETQKKDFCNALTILEYKKYQNKTYEHKFYLSSFKFLTGLLPYLAKKISHIKFQLVGYTPPPLIQTINLPPNITLRDYQEEVVRANLTFGRGINNLATGAGKTAIACATIYHLNLPTLFIVHTTELAKQTQSEFIKFGIPPSDIGLYYSQEKNLNKKIVIALIQSLNQSIHTKPVQDFLNSRQVIFIDESHHTPAHSYMNVIKRTPAPYRFGLSGSVFVDIDNPTVEDMKLMGATGRVIATISYQTLLEKGFLSSATCYFITPPKQEIPVSIDYTQTYRDTIVLNQQRNTLISQYASKAYNASKQVCIVVKHIEHGDILLKLLKEKHNIDAFFYLGNQLVKQYKHSEIKTFFQSKDFLPLSDFKNKEKFVLILSPAFFEGIDIPSISVIIRADAGRSKKIDYQIIGRGIRLKPQQETSHLTIIDFNDNYNYIFKQQSKKRQENYISLGIEVKHL